MYKKTILIAISFILLVATFASSGLVLAQYNDPYIKYGKKIVSIKTGDKIENIKYSGLNKEDVLINGPISFAVSNNEDILLLDTNNNIVKIFDSEGNFLDLINLPNDREYYDIEITKDRYSFVLLTHKGSLMIYEDMKFVEELNYNEEIEEKDIIFLRLKKDDSNNIKIWDTKKNQVIDLKANTILENNIEISQRTNDNLRIDFGNQIVDIDYQFTPAGTYPVMELDNNVQLILKNEALIGNSIYVETRIGKYKDGKKVASALAIPTNDYYTSVPRKYIYVRSNGNGYQLVCNEQSVDIYLLAYNKDKQTNIDERMIQSLNPQNINIDSSDETKTISTRDYVAGLAWANAQDMVYHSWYYIPSTMKTPNTSTKTING